MAEYREIEGNLITLAQNGEFDVIAHGCSCSCIMGSGIAPQIARAFPKAEEADNVTVRGDMRKLGSFTGAKEIVANDKVLMVLNIYSQFAPGAPGVYGIPLDYDALTVALRKVNYYFKDMHIGLPLIGCGLAGGDWTRVKGIIQNELKDLKQITIVNYIQ